MTDLSSRYLSGECESVREALRDSIDAKSPAENVAIAEAVADEFVSRAISNLTRLYDALLTIEYGFADPASAFVLHTSPSEASVAAFEQRMGRMPLIASRWYRRIKSVDFTQTYQQLTDRQSPLAGLGWNVPLIVQSLEKAQEHWEEHCRQCEADDRSRASAGYPTHGPPPRTLFTGGCASNNDCKGFNLPSFRFDDVLFNDGGGDRYFGDEIASGFKCGGFPVLCADKRTLNVIRSCYGEPDGDYLSLKLPKTFEAL